MIGSQALLNPILQCCVIPEIFVGFSSTSYTVAETSGHITVCVEVFNPPSGGATEEFNVTLLPAEG